MSRRRIDPWEQESAEPAAAFAAFRAFLAMDRAERSVRSAYAAHSGRTDESPPGSFFEWARDWRWKERALAFDREVDRIAMERLRTKRLKSLEMTAELGAVLKAKALSAIRTITAVSQQVGIRDGREVWVIETRMSPMDVARFAEVGAKLEMLALGGPTERTELMGNAEAPLVISVDNAKEKLRDRLTTIQKRRELANGVVQRGSM